MTNLIDSIKAYVTPELLGQAAGLLGENEGGISKAIGGLAPVLLAGLLDKTGDPNTADGIFQMLGDFDSGALNRLDKLIGGGNLAHNDPKDAAGHLTGALFGAKVPAVTNAVAAFSGTKPATVSALLGMTGPLVMGILSDRIRNEGLSASGLANVLQDEKNSILGALPTGLSAVLGLAVGQDNAAEPSATGNSWLWPLVLLLGLGGGIIYYLKNC